MLPEWYIIQAKDYISMVQDDASMYTHSEILEVTKKQRQFEYALMRHRNGLPAWQEKEPLNSHSNTLTNIPLPQVHRPNVTTEKDLMSLGVGAPNPRKSIPNRKQVNSYA